MPFKSKSQQRKICATDKKLCEEYASKTPKSAYKNMPEKVSSKKANKKWN